MKPLTNNNGEIIHSPFFGGRSDGVKMTKKKFLSKDKDDIVTYELIDVVKKTGEGETDYVLIPKLVEKGRVNRRDSINSHREDVGILNILRQCALAKQDPTDGRFASDQKFVDISKLPRSKEEAYQAVEKGVKAFDGLPEDMKKKMSMAKFVEAFGADEVKKYLNDKYPQNVDEKGKGKNE